MLQCLVLISSEITNLFNLNQDKPHTLLYFQLFVVDSAAAVVQNIEAYVVIIQHTYMLVFALTSSEGKKRIFSTAKSHSTISSILQSTASKLKVMDDAVATAETAFVVSADTNLGTLLTAADQNCQVSASLDCDGTTEAFIVHAPHGHI